MVKRIKKESTYVISVRMTRAEIALLKLSAKKAKLTLSEYIRYISSKKRAS